MLVLATIAGLTAGTVVWFAASHWIATSIAWAEDRRPALAGSKRLRAAEAVSCSVLFLACLALAFWIMRLWIQIMR